MEIYVKYFGPVRVATGRTEEVLEVDGGTTVMQLLKRLAGVYGKSFEGEIFEEGGALKDDLMLTRNGAAANHTGIVDVCLEADDVIVLLPIFLGGG